MRAKESRETKKLIKRIILFSILGIGLALIIANPTTFKICFHEYEWDDKIGCLDDYNEGVAQSLFFFSIIFIFSSLILLSLREEIFRSWWRFARVYLIIAIGFVLLATLSPGGGSFGVSNSFDGEQAAWFISGLFLVISLTLIIVKSWRLRKSSTPNS